MPLLFVGIAYWAICFSLGHVLGLKIGLGATGIWIGLSIEKNIYKGPPSSVSRCGRAGVHSEPSLDCVMAVLGERESRNARRLRGSLRLQRGQGVPLETKFLTAQSPAVPCLQRHIETNLPAQFDIHLVLGNHATTSIQGAGPPEVQAGTFSPAYASCLNQVERFLRLITRHAHPASPSSSIKCDNRPAHVIQLYALHVNS